MYDITWNEMNKIQINSEYYASSPDMDYSKQSALLLCWESVRWLMKGYKFHAWWIVIHGGTKSWTIENVRKERELTSGKGLSKRQRKLRRFGFGYLHP